MNFDDFQLLVVEVVNWVVRTYNSSFFSVVKFFFGIYALVLLIDIVLLLIGRDIGKGVRQAMMGMNVPPEIVRKKKAMRATWDKVRKRLASANESEYKVAIIEADKLIDDLIERMGYEGTNMGERLENIPVGQIGSTEALKKAHEVRNRVIHEEGFQVSREDAQEVLGWYEEFLKEFEIMD